MANKNEVFIKTIGVGESAKTESFGFFGFNASRIFKVFSDKSRVAQNKMEITPAQVQAVMKVVDNINAADRTVVEITGGRRLDDLHFFDTLKDAFFGPRDIRFTESALRSPNLVVNNDGDVITSTLKWVEFNEVIHYLKEKSSLTSLNYSAMGVEPIHGGLELLKDRMLIITEGNTGVGFEPSKVRFYIPRDAEKLVAPVMVTPDVAKLLYNESKFTDDVDEFCDEYIDRLEKFFGTK